MKCALDHCTHIRGTFPLSLSLVMLALSARGFEKRDVIGVSRDTCVTSIREKDRWKWEMDMRDDGERGKSADVRKKELGDAQREKKERKREGRG